MQRILLIIYIVFGLGMSPLRAQSQCNVTYYDEFSGLAQWWVTQIIQDKQGIIWISTWNGLNRYDGYEFACFKSHAGDGVDIPSDRIDDMYLADDGSLRCEISKRIFGFCTKTCKFFHLKPSEERYWQTFLDRKQKREYADELAQRPYYYKDKYGTEWKIYREGMLQYKNPATGDYVVYPVDWHGAKKIHMCTVDTQGNVWLTSDYGVFKLMFEKKSYRLFEQEIPMQVRSFFKDKRHRFWITTREDATVRLYDSQNRLLGYLGGDGQLHPKYTSFGSPVYHVMQDSRGDYWLSTKPKGLYRLRDKANGGFDIEHFKHQEGDKGSLSDDELYHTIEDHRGRIWVATFETGLNCIENPQADKIRFVNKNNGLRYPKDVVQRVRQIHITKDNILLAATTTGLVVADISPKNLRDIRFKYHQKEADRNNSLSKNTTMYVSEDMQHQLYVCTESGGLNQIVSRDLLADKLDFRHINVQTGFPSDVILSAVPHKDYLMVVCRNQVVKLYTAGKQKGKIEPFFISDHFRFSDARPTEMGDGRWIFGLQDGAFTIALKDMNIDEFIPPIVFTGLTIGNQDLQRSVSLTDTLVLMPDQRTFTIHYAALDYSGNEVINYAFKMGKNGLWNNVGNNTMTSFYDLHPGVYHLSIRSTNSQGAWVDNERQLTIIVKPTFWETPWSYFIYAIGILLIIAVSSYLLFTYYRMRQKMTVEQQISDIKLRFFTNISHELRTPLTLIYGFISEILRERDIDPGLRPRLAVVNDNANRMLILVNQILDVYKMKSDKMKLSVRRLDLIPLVKSVMANFDNIAKSHQIDFQLESHAPSLHLWADSDKLDKILFNLIGNAFKYTPKGKKIVVSVEENGPDAVIRVTDQGVGISEENRRNLFEEFSPSSSRNIFNLPSSGLGLSFTKNLVDLLGGTITVESEVGVGSAFIVTLPRDRSHFSDENTEFILSDETAPATDNIDPFADAVPVVENDDDTDKVTLLVIEDNEQMRYLLRTILSSQYHLLEAENGEVGLQLARKHIPDIIICDIMMPVMDGVELLTHIRQDSTTSHIPVIMLTAKSDDDSQMHSILGGADSYIVKPFNSEILKARLQNLLNKRDRMQKYYQSHFLDMPSVPLPPNASPAPQADDEAFISKVMKVATDHLSDGDFTVEMMASEMNMSRSVLFKKLKAITGLSPKEYLKILRMRHAAELITKTSHSISEITYMVGINDPHYFSNCFKKQYGMSPTEYRACATKG